MCSASGWSACCCTHSAAWLHVVLESCTGASWPLNATMMCAGLCTIIELVDLFCSLLALQDEGTVCLWLKVMKAWIICAFHRCMHALYKGSGFCARKLHRQRH